MGRDVLLVGEADTAGAFPFDEGRTVDVCASPDEALARLRSGAPCDVVVAAELAGMDGVNLRELLSHDRLRALAGSVDGLPSLPHIYSDLTAALESPNCGAPEIAGVVCRDPALAAKTLQLANSSFFGLPRPVTSVPEAVAFHHEAPEPLPGRAAGTLGTREAVALAVDVSLPAG